MPDLVDKIKSIKPQICGEKFYPYKFLSYGEIWQIVISYLVFWEKNLHPTVKICHPIVVTLALVENSP